MTVPESGMLSLGINDNDLADNCGELVIRILSENPEKQRANLLKNGDFVQGLDFWEIQRNPLCEHCSVEVIPGDTAHPYILIWESTHSDKRPAAVRVYQRPDIDLRGCTSLKLSFDVCLDQYNLPNNGSRFYGEHGEYPAKITIRFLDPESQRIEWTSGFLHAYDGTRLVNYTLVPPTEWYTYSIDLLDPENWVDHTGEPLPRAETLYEFNISGSGYDFKAAIANLRLEGCQPGMD